MPLLAGLLLLAELLLILSLLLATQLQLLLFLAAFAAGNAAVAAFGIVNATYLAVAGGAAVAVVDRTALAAG